jgi:hypothetical protein
MRWLFAVFLLSLCALLWAAFAIARHIRRASPKLPVDAAILTKNEEHAELPQDVQ